MRPAIKKILLTAAFFFLLEVGITAQKKEQPASVGISFVLIDFATPERIRASSLRQVVSNGDWAGINEMAPGFSVSYIKNLRTQTDLAATLTGAFGNDALPEIVNSSPAFLLQADATIHYRVLSNRHVVTPYLLGGVGASKLKGYYGAYMPVGGGIRVNFFNEAAFFIQAKYHVPVTTATVRAHFIYGIGIAGIVGKRNEVL
ncbi:MAG: hypothetical protein ACO1NX_01825 [Chitinophagaceae bacterium]